ncbi:DUF433 domain-containing protein [bacterium]|nr:DUF433 domain-containing protein [bacterium]
MITKIENYIRFEGIYEASEASKFITTTLKTETPLNVTSRKVIYWIRRGLTDKDLIITPGRELLLTFEDVISMRVISALRAAGVKFSKIYDAEKWLRQVTGHHRPFATEMLWTEKSDVFIDMKRQLIAASRSGQYAFQILEEYLIPVHGITFSKQHIAQTWEPYTNILLDPVIQFGAPCIKGTRIPTRALWGMVMGGDTIEYVAQSYHLLVEHVQNAINWEDTLIQN